MKKLLGIVVLGLLWCGNAFADEKTVLPKIELVGDKISNSINAHIQAGFNIVDVSATDNIVVYTLRKKKTVKVCYLILTTNKILDCVYP